MKLLFTSLNNNYSIQDIILILFTGSSSLLQMLREILVQEMLGVEDLSPTRFRICQKYI